MRVHIDREPSQSYVDPATGRVVREYPARHVLAPRLLRRGAPQRGRRGAMMRYAFNPSPSRSRSSESIGSSAVSSFTRSRR